MTRPHPSPRTRGASRSGTTARPGFPVALPSLPAHAGEPQLPPISVVCGYVRIGTVYTWSGARAALRKDIHGSYPVGMFPRDIVLQRRAYELERASADVRCGVLITSGTWAWGDTVRYAQEGEHGLTAGDLAYLHDYSNGSRYGWTVDVKCSIVAITPGHKVTVRITGESLQFRRGQTLTVPATFLRPRTRKVW